MSFEVIKYFEDRVAEFFGAPYAVAVDSCTHGIELCLRLTKTTKINVPVRTYLSVPMLANKLGIELDWRYEKWEDYYTLNYDDRRIIDAAVLWRENSYQPNTFMCLSFQFQKHLSLGRGGMILLDNEEDALQLKKMSYDGRLPDIPWRDQNIDTLGYHYYMTPETAQRGLNKLENAINTEPRKWKYEDWPDLTKMPVFMGSYLQTS
jgi:dTDP-4-amino-4,6-dideoxygalactose transaminase